MNVRRPTAFAAGGGSGDHDAAAAETWTLGTRKIMKALRSGLDRKQVFVLDALRYSCLNEWRVYSRLTGQLRRISRLRVKSIPRESLAADALASAWQLVDTTYRIRMLARQVRGLSQKRPEMQIFLRGTTDVEEFRHLYQHLDSAIPKISGQAFPIMGVISWVTDDPKLSCTMTVGNWGPETSMHSLAVDTWTGSLVVMIRLDAGTSSLDLANLHRAVRRLNAFLELWLRQQKLVTHSKAAASILRFGIALPAG